MKKYSLFFLLIFASFLFQSSASALSCLPTPNRVALVGESNQYIQFDKDQFHEFSVKDPVSVAMELSVSSLDGHRDLRHQYLDGKIINTDHALAASPISVPAEYSHLVQSGDVVVIGGPSSASACGGPAYTSIFDKDSGHLKMVSAKNISYSRSIDLGKDTIALKPVGSLEKNSSVVFTLGADAEVSLNKFESVSVIDNDFSTLKLTGIKNRTDELWFGGAHASFAVIYDSPSFENKCDIPYTRLIQYGVRGTDVKALQTCLNGLGYDTGLVDGKYGPKTFSGIKSFQKSQKIKIDGIVGPQTVKFLNRK